MSKKTLCLALCALAAGKAMANGGYWNNAYVGGGGKSDASVDGIGVAGSGTVSVATAFANDKVQGSNTISGSGALVDGYEGYVDAYGASDAYAGSENYDGVTDTYSDSYADAHFDEWYGPSSHSSGDFQAGAHGAGITGAMGGQATVAVAEEYYDDDWWGTRGTAGAIGISGSKARQAEDTPRGFDMLEIVDEALDTMTEEEFVRGTAAVAVAGPTLNWLG